MVKKNIIGEPVKQRIEGLIAETLIEAGFNLEEEGMKRTPLRMREMYEKMTSGFDMEVTLTRVYSESSSMIASNDIQFVSLCEHHLLPFHGTVSIAYIPKKGVTGMSKLDQLVKKYSLRPQIQERLGEQIADELWKDLDLYGCMVVIRAMHTCKLIEGFPPGEYVTSALRGVFLWSTGPREEAMKLMSGGEK